MDPKYLFWENIDNNNFLLFIRDLSEGIITNIKNLVDDVPVDKSETKKKKRKKIL